MTTKEYLQQAQKIDRRIKLDRGKLAAMRSALYSPSISYESDGVQHIPGGNVTENAIQSVIEYEERINAEIEELIRKRLEIEDVIAGVTDDVQKEILTRRYLLYQKWEVIAVEMAINLRWIYRLHGRALKKLTIESH